MTAWGQQQPQQEVWAAQTLPPPQWGVLVLAVVITRWDDRVRWIDGFSGEGAGDLWVAQSATHA